MWIEHILVGIIIIVMPVLSTYQLRSLKVSQDPHSKIKLYLKSISGLWIITGVIWYVSSAQELYYFNYNIQINMLMKAILILCFIFFIVTTIMPLFLLKNEEFKAKLIDSFKERQFILPVTKLELYLFGFLAVTVGICEEMIFRSFLVHYLYNLPFELTVTLSIIAAGILFGLSHFHQGMSGVVSATVIGFLLSYLFVVTGSLLVPIIVHVMYDMKVLLLSRIARK